MRKAKRVLAVLIALVLTLSMAAAAFADDGQSATPTPKAVNEKTVKATPSATPTVTPTVTPTATTTPAATETPLVTEAPLVTETPAATETPEEKVAAAEEEKKDEPEEAAEEKSKEAEKAEDSKDKVELAVETYKIQAKSENEDCGTVTGGGEYAEGQVFTLTATAREGFEFVRWVNEETGASSTSNPLDLTATEDAKYVASFKPAEYTVKVKSSDDACGQITVEKMETFEEVSKGKYAYGTELKLTATPIDDAEFDNWTDKDGKILSEETEFIYTVKKADTITANFKKEVVENEYTVTAKAAPAEGGKAEGSGKYKEGAEATVKASPEKGYKFVNWTDADGKEISTAAEYSFKVTADTTLTANFEKVITITAKADPAEGGKAEGSGEYKEGADVTVKATANAGYVFVNWTDESGKALSDKAEYSFKAEKDLTVTAHFVRIYRVSYTVYGDSKYGTPTDSATPAAVANIKDGTTIQLAAAPTTKWTTSNGKSNGVKGTWTFAGWYTDKEFTNRVTSLTVKADTTVYGKWTFKAATSVTPAKTGDSTNVWMLVSMILVASACIFVVCRRKHV